VGDNKVSLRGPFWHEIPIIKHPYSPMPAQLIRRREARRERLRG
jgi:hypothetical protein